MANAITVNSEISDDVPKPVRRKRFPVVIAAIAVFAAVGGSGYWFLSHKSSTNDSAATQKMEAPPIYVPLESFTVNLQPETGDQFLQVAMSLRVSGATVADKLKIRMPEIRNCLLFLLSSKHASELITSAGKEKLGKEIQAELTRLLEPGATKSVAPEAKVAVDVPDTTLEASAAPAASATPAAPDTSSETPTPQPASEAKISDAVEEKPAAASVGSPITGVLFTSFIIQ